MSYHILTFKDDLIAHCAKVVIDDFEARLPDLREAVIILPEAVGRTTPQIAEIRHCLLNYAQQKGCPALMQPIITTPHHLFLQRDKSSRLPKITRYQEQLILARALSEHPDLFPNQNVWQVSHTLIKLFNEISELNATETYNRETLEKSLSKLESDVWSEDAQMFLRLWGVWEELILEKQFSSQQRERLAFIENTLLKRNEQVYLCGVNQLTPCQVNWLKNLYAENRLTLFTQGSPHPARYSYPQHALSETICNAQISPPLSSNHFSQFIDAVFSSDTPDMPFGKRVQKTVQSIAHSPLKSCTRIFTPHSFEQHAWGIYLAVQRWIEQDQLKKISIVCLDRKLARRIRALFDRYGLMLQDYSGWELSTTSSAATVFKLLPREGEPFGMNTLVSLLRSPLCNHGLSYRQQIQLVWQIENLVSRLEQLPSTLHELLNALSERSSWRRADAAQRGSGGTRTASKESSFKRLDVVRKVVGVLGELQAMADAKPRLLTEYFDALYVAMEELGMRKRLALDEAGRALLSELAGMYEAAKKENTVGSFRFWRSWFMHTMEECRYALPPPQRGVLLLNMHQAMLWKSDAMILAALDKRRLPSPNVSIMNESIRHELGLETWEQHRENEFSLFRASLENSGQVLLTYQCQSDGEPLPPSAWLEAIQQFHHRAYDDDLIDHQLMEQAKHCASKAVKHNISTPPVRQARPAPPAPFNTFPKSISSSAYKNMMDCPYRFFVQNCLGLRSFDKPSRYLDNRMFGTCVHRIIQTLHSTVDVAWTGEHQEHIRAAADNIIRKTLGGATQTNYANTHWFYRAQEVIYGYIAWVVEFVAPDGDAEIESEVKESKTLGESLVLSGTLDLVIKTKDGEAIVDFKTGALPMVKNIRNGEDVQLACYALLRDEAQDAFYLSLKRDPSKATLQQRHITNVEQDKQEMQDRLCEIYADYTKGAKLVAWGNEKTACTYCNWEGLCRRTTWC